MTPLNKQQPQGNYDVEFDGSQLTSGIFFYRIDAGNFSDLKKIVILD